MNINTFHNVSRKRKSNDTNRKLSFIFFKTKVFLLYFDLLTRPKMPFKVVHRKEVKKRGRKRAGRKEEEEKKENKKKTRNKNRPATKTVK